MATRVGLYYFSGTGNTEIVAELIQAAFKRHAAQTDVFKIESILRGRVPLDLDRYDLVGVGHPIYGLDAPRILYEFVDALAPVRDKPAFVFKSAADYIWINNGASKTLIRRLEGKGYHVFYDRIICMASNWWMRYEDALAKQLYEAAIPKTEHMCQEILAGVQRRLPISSVLVAMTRLLHQGEDWGARVFGKHLRVSDACVDCGTCIEQCPTGNIRRDKGRIVFGGDCMWCMRCIYACPKAAILPRLARFCVLKGGYDIRGIVADPSIKGDFVSEDTRGYLGRFRGYVKDVTL